MNLYQRFIHWAFPPSESWRKLTDKLPVLRAEIDAWKYIAGADLPNKPWLKIADDLYKDLLHAVDHREIQRGWKIYKSIGRILLHSMAEQEEQSQLSRAKAIFYEAQGKMEIDSWRRKAILELVGKSDAATPEKWVFNDAATTDDIIKANEILDEHQDNFYENLQSLDRQIRLLSWTAIGAIILFVYIAPRVGSFPNNADIPQAERDSILQFLREMRNIDTVDPGVANDAGKPGADAPEEAPPTPTVDNPESDPPVPQSGANPPDAKVEQPGEKKSNSEQVVQTNRQGDQGKQTSIAKEQKPVRKDIPINQSPRMLSILVILMGIIGAVVSGFLRVIQAGTENSIPGQLFGSTILTARLVLATVAALAVYIFLGTGLLLLFSSTISFELLLAFCFIAGFSEQLVKKGVETLTKEEMYKGQKPK